MAYTFTYTNNGEHITMSVPERPLDEMCEYLERFLRASGYYFEDGERIRWVKPEKDESDYPGCMGDTLTFNDDGTPYCYDFGGGPVPIGVYSGVRGGMADDIIKFD